MRDHATTASARFLGVLVRHRRRSVGLRPETGGRCLAVKELSADRLVESMKAWENLETMGGP